MTLYTKDVIAVSGITFSKYQIVTGERERERGERGRPTDRDRERKGRGRERLGRNCPNLQGQALLFATPSVS